RRHPTYSPFFPTPRSSDSLAGLNRDGTRLVIVNFAEDFAVKELADKKADYTVTLREIKQKVLPPLDDAFAARVVSGKTLLDLRQDRKGTRLNSSHLTTSYA